MDQIQKGLRYAEQKKEENVLGYSRTAENGTRTLQTVEFNQNTQSHDANPGEPEEEINQSEESKGALSRVSGTDDYYDAKEMDVTSTNQTFGPGFYSSLVLCFKCSVWLELFADDRQQINIKYHLGSRHESSEYRG